MSSIGRVAWALIMSAAVTAGTEPTSPNEGLRLIIRADADSTKIGDPVGVVVLLENMDHAAAWTLIPKLVIASSESPRYPEPFLAIRIVGPGGRELHPNPPPGSTKRIPPSTCDFAYFGPGQIVGRRLDLTQPPLSFAFTEPGSYTVTAVVTSQAGTWLRGSKQAHTCAKDFSRVFDGTLESEAVTVDIR